MTTKERVENYNGLTLFDKQWLLNVMLDRDILVHFPHTKTLKAGGGILTQRSTAHKSN